ncbi:hypothetical protein HNY73_014323 [Argiope bruennichi]|uniref:Uncharacterized protein n=1 Tax=Argiope bruennichi TaxID=94029 RepID=A0A8T0ESR0_ARGBR|nr:hypothetical protein HNY73_014323 [Argiope bruennichi]
MAVNNLNMTGAIILSSTASRPTGLGKKNQKNPKNTSGIPFNSNFLPPLFIKLVFAHLWNSNPTDRQEVFVELKKRTYSPYLDSPGYPARYSAEEAGMVEVIGLLFIIPAKCSNVLATPRCLPDYPSITVTAGSGPKLKINQADPVFVGSVSLSWMRIFY